jgi:hypothetical protein
MQPYFFPYIGYFQLIKAVDTYVNLDHVSFMKASYMTRNTLKNGVKINIPVSGGSQNKTCREVNVIDDEEWFDKFAKTLDQLYKKEKNYEIILEEILIPWKQTIEDFKITQNELSISLFNYFAIQRICKYLDIKTLTFSTSLGLTTKKKNEGLQDIVKHFEGTHYINAIGGQAIYTKEDFASQGIELMFIKNKSELPNTSILDLLFRYDKEVIKKELNNYKLI